MAGAKGFIADHMPPTLFVNKAMDSWWARVLGPVFPLRQRLYPQCQECFGLQGAHVKAGRHLMVYFNYPRSVHLSPLLADYMAESKLGTEVGSLIVDPLLPGIQNVVCSIQKVVDGLR